MQRKATQTHALPEAAVRDALAQLDASRSSLGATRHRVLLRHLVTRLLAGDTPALKESGIAVEVFGRPAGSFDPVRESIVRVEARRLRARLAAYNAGEGRAAPLRIEVPVGSYVPQVVTVDSLPTGAEATRRARDLVERGEHHLRQPLSRSSLEAAQDRFDAALREAPDPAAACVGLGRAWLNLATGWYRDPAIASEHAAEALQRALLLDPTRRWRTPCWARCRTSSSATGHQHGEAFVVLGPGAGGCVRVGGMGLPPEHARPDGGGGKCIAARAGAGPAVRRPRSLGGLR